MDEREPSSIGGYRVVRKLGEGARAEVFLGYPVREGSHEPPAALKLYRPDVGQESIVREVEALGRSAGPHVVGLHDVVLGPVNALILQRLSRGGLARLLVERDELSVGEAITIAVPVLDAVSRMHRAGCVHGTIAAERVLFTKDGAPMLVGFGAASAIDADLPPARLRDDVGVVADLSASASLISQVLGRVSDKRAYDLADWLDSARYRHEDGWCEQVTARLFDLGAAKPIEFDAVPNLVAEPRGRAMRPQAVEPPAPSGMVTRAVGLPRWLEPTISGALERFASRASGLRRSVRHVRPAVWGIAAGVGLALTAAVLIVPSESGTATVTPGVTPSPVTPTASAGGPEQRAILSEDPIAAAVVLLETRSRCFRELSTGCLDAVGQQGSAALAADRSAIRDVIDGAELPSELNVSAERLSVVDQLGDAVLLELTDPAESEPASLLLMKGEAGWRIRDYLT